MTNTKYRRRARKLAFQAIFMLEARVEWDMSLVREFLARPDSPSNEEIREYALRLAQTVVDHRSYVDEWIDQVHPKWRIRRMVAEDRNMLRCGASEIWFHDDVPPKAALNEWIEIAKIFGGDESPRFINGILDRAVSEREQHSKTANSI